MVFLGLGLGEMDTLDKGGGAQPGAAKLVRREISTVYIGSVIADTRERDGWEHGWGG